MSGERGLAPEIREYYERGGEIGRLDQGIGLLEAARVRELLARFLPPPPAAVFDIGGGPGHHALWLARQGYAVHLLDPVPLHCRQAAAASAAQPGFPLTSIQEGDARALPLAGGAADAVLLLGPLYHLTAHGARLQALREARRLLRPAGLLLAVAITRYASTLVGFQRGWLADQAFQAMIAEELASGRHRTPPQRPEFFTTAYFHRPDQLSAEITDAGFAAPRLIAVHGPGWISPDLEEALADAQRRQAILDTVRRLEEAPWLLGLSPHILAVARRDP